MRTVHCVFGEASWSKRLAPGTLCNRRTGSAQTVPFYSDDVERTTCPVCRRMVRVLYGQQRRHWRTLFGPSPTATNSRSGGLH